MTLALTSPIDRRGCPVRHRLSVRLQWISQRLHLRTVTIMTSCRIVLRCSAVALTSNHILTAIGVPSQLQRYTTENPPVPS